MSIREEAVAESGDLKNGDDEEEEGEAAKLHP